MSARADLAAAGQRVTQRYNRPMVKIAAIALLLVFAGLQYRLWIADGGWSEVNRLDHRRNELVADNAHAAARNAAMQAEIDDLKAGQSATEGHARADLGMIKHDETFFLTVSPLSARDARQASR